MGGVGHKHLRFPDVGNLVLGDHLLVQLLALALDERVALAFLVFPFDFFLAHHVLLVELPLLEAPVRGGDDAEHARRDEDELAAGRTEKTPHVADVALRDAKQLRHVVGKNDIHADPQDQDLDDVLEELHQVLEGKDLLEPFAHAQFFKLGHGGLYGKQHAHLHQVGTKGHGHDHADERQGHAQGTEQDGRGGQGQGLLEGPVHEQHGDLAHGQHGVEHVGGQGQQIDAMTVSAEGTSWLLATWPFSRESRRRFGVGCSVFSLLMGAWVSAARGCRHSRRTSVAISVPSRQEVVQLEDGFPRKIEQFRCM